MVGGLLLRVELVFGETQEEQLSACRVAATVRVLQSEVPKFSGGPMSMTIQQVATQLQQELFSLRA